MIGGRKMVDLVKKIPEQMMIQPLTSSEGALQSANPSTPILYSQATLLALSIYRLERQGRIGRDYPVITALASSMMICMSL
jgi:hypothetical protein